MGILMIDETAVMNDSQRAVYDLLRETGPMPCSQIAYMLRKSDSVISPRIHELRSMGKVTASHRAKYPDDGRTVFWWTVVHAGQS